MPLWWAVESSPTVDINQLAGTANKSLTGLEPWLYPSVAWYFFHVSKLVEIIMSEWLLRRAELPQMSVTGDRRNSNLCRRRKEEKKRKNLLWIRCNIDRRGPFLPCSVISVLFPLSSNFKPSQLTACRLHGSTVNGSFFSFRT